MSGPTQYCTSSVTRSEHSNVAAVAPPMIRYQDRHFTRFSRVLEYIHIVCALSIRTSGNRTVWKSDYGGYGHKNSVGTLLCVTVRRQSEATSGACVDSFPPSQEEEIEFELPNTNNVLRSRWHRRRCFCVHSTINRKVADNYSRSRAEMHKPSQNVKINSKRQGDSLKRRGRFRFVDSAWVYWDASAGAGAARTSARFFATSIVRLCVMAPRA